MKNTLKHKDGDSKAGVQLMHMYYNWQNDGIVTPPYKNQDMLKY